MPKLLMIPSAGKNPYAQIIAGGLGPEYTLARADERLDDVDVIHLHWPENRFFWKGWRQRIETHLAWLKLHAAIARVRRRGGSLVWTCHNLERHEPFPPRMRGYAERQLARVYAAVDLAIAMSGEQVDMLRRRFPVVPPENWRIIPHPHYRTTYPEGRSRGETREALGLPAGVRLISMLGNLRSYKGVVRAIEVFRAAARPDEVLLVAGSCRDRRLRRKLRRAASGAANVRLRMKSLSRDDYAAFQRASDLALFNFEAILNSGSLLAALSLDCPVLARSTPTFDELQRNNPNWVFLFEGPLSPASLRAGIDRATASPRPASPDLSRHAPIVVAAAHKAVYAEALKIGAARRAQQRGFWRFQREAGPAGR